MEEESAIKHPDASLTTRMVPEGVSLYVNEIFDHLKAREVF